MLYSVTNIQRLADGRIAVIAQWGPNGIYGADLMIFVEQDGTFLLDQWVDEALDFTRDF